MSRLLPALVALCSLSCGTGLVPADPGDTDTDTERPDTPLPFVPSEARMHRLTAPQYRASVHALLGVPVRESLPVDYRLHGFTRVGAAELSIGAADLDQYEAAAWQIASDALSDEAERDRRLDCPLDRVEPASACVGPWAAGLARAAWRRPLDRQDLDLLLDVYDTAAEVSGSRTVGTQAVVATILQSPWFLFRIEVGTPTEDPLTRRLTEHELAARLSAFLTGAPPDAELMADAEAGRLADDAVLRAHAQRLLDAPDAHEHLGRFFDELLDLDRVRTVSKDPDRFPGLTPELREAMIGELRALFTDVVLTRDEDVRTLLTTDRAWVTPALASHYGLPPVAGPEWVILPKEQDRGGLLGRPGFLTVESHPAATSPTHRGLFVQTRLLCNTVDPPPEGVETTLPELDPDKPMTTRERLSQHADDPNCRGCHNLTDPIGLALEHYDPVGAYRETEHGLPIDASATVNGQQIDGAGALGQVISEHPQLPDCLVRQLYRHALGQHESIYEESAIDALSERLQQQDHRLSALILDLVSHPAFRTVSEPSGEACEEEGAVQPCRSVCGAGERVCMDGVWRGCSAPQAQPETCSGLDDDCDGEVDEAIRTCVSDGKPGIEACDAGDWSGQCAVPDDLPETCNGLDDDRDGEIDEELDFDRVQSSAGELADTHASCSVFSSAGSGPCRAAIHRTCRSSPCSITGFGPLSLDAGTGRTDLACLDSTQAEVHTTTYTALGTHHGGCTQASPWGSHCNAAINRWCDATGGTTGFGPIEHSGDTAVIVCTPKAHRIALVYADLAPYSPPEGPACNGESERLGAACNEAIHGWCADKGYRTGHGPLENSHDNVHIACIE